MANVLVCGECGASFRRRTERGKVVTTMQDNCELIAKTTTNVFEGKECDEEKIKEFIDSVLSAIAGNKLTRIV